VYIIGGISDNSNSLKGLTYKTACENGVATAKLPLNLINTRKQVLNVNHGMNGCGLLFDIHKVFEIIENVVNGDDWQTALERSVPTRFTKSNDQHNEET
jgi:hypothetical protein